MIPLQEVQVICRFQVEERELPLRWQHARPIYHSLNQVAKSSSALLHHLIEWNHHLFALHYCLRQSIQKGEIRLAEWLSQPNALGQYLLLPNLKVLLQKLLSL